MWKDFFYFSKGQRTGIAVLILLILFVVVLNVFLPRIISPNPEPTAEVQTEMLAFRLNLRSLDSLRAVTRQQEYESRFRSDYAFRDFGEKPTAYSLFPFDPNTADSATFVKLGLKPYVAANVLKFRAKGAQFRTPESFSKVYGISAEKFSELEPYISIKSSETALRSDSAKQLAVQKVENIVVELNTADTTLLMQVKGVGRFLARGIVRFRMQAGGFVSVEQLRDVYGMREENYLKIKDSFRVNTGLVQKIQVNTASVDKLKNHPYLSFYQAKAIYELRRKEGKLKSVHDLKQIDEIDEQVLVKLAPYLSFD